MPSYRLIFPTPPDVTIENTRTAEIESGDVVYEVGALIKHHGKLWRVTEAPLDHEGDGVSDLMVWPAE